jgi:hypothetical protein
MQTIRRCVRHSSFALRREPYCDARARIIRLALLLLLVFLNHAPPPSSPSPPTKHPQHARYGPRRRRQGEHWTQPASSAANWPAERDRDRKGESLAFPRSFLRPSRAAPAFPLIPATRPACAA